MNIAIFIDAENIDPVYAEQIFNHAESKGTIATREIYGAGIALNEWSDAILRYALHTNMTLKPSRYKNSTDIALVIGAMDILVERAAHGTTADIVIIASSDSDYSALALRLRTSGIEVIGMGKEGRINPSWPMACSEFIAFTPVGEMRQEGQSKLHPASPSHKADDPVAHSVGRDSAQRKHIDRVTNIRKFISDQLSKSGGQMHSASLFNLLKELPDYQYDQQRSKRSPLDYLTKQYSDLLRIQKNPDGVLWVYSKLIDDVVVTGGEDGSAQQGMNPQPEDPQAKENTPPALIEFLCSGGMNKTDALKVSSTYEKCSNMRDVYNLLRKSFKTKTGTAYYKLVKQYQESQNKEQPSS